MKLKYIAAILHALAIPCALQSGNDDFLFQNDQYTNENVPFFYLYQCALDECNHSILPLDTNSLIPLVNHLITGHHYSCDFVEVGYSTWGNDFLFSFFAPILKVPYPEASYIIKNEIILREDSFSQNKLHGKTSPFKALGSLPKENGEMLEHQTPLKINVPWLQKVYHCSDHDKTYFSTNEGKTSRQNGGRTSMQSHLKDTHGSRHGSINYKKYRCRCAPKEFYDTEKEALDHIHSNHKSLICEE